MVESLTSTPVHWLRFLVLEDVGRAGIGTANQYKKDINQDDKPQNRSNPNYQDKNWVSKLVSETNKGSGTTETKLLNAYKKVLPSEKSGVVIYKSSADDRNNLIKIN